jgi:DNA repair protein RadC
MEKQKSSHNGLSENELRMYEISESKYSVKDIPERLRPREEMERRGVKNVSDEVLLAIILRTGARGTNVIDLSRALLLHYGSLSNLANATMKELTNFKGIGKVKAQILLSALQIGRNMIKESLPQTTAIKSPVDVINALNEEIQTLDKEIFWVLHLDSKNQFDSQPEVITTGLLNSSLVHPREVFRKAIRNATCAVILAHNHPSGDPTPSPEDIKITRQLVEAGKIIDIKVLDHIIIGRKSDNHTQHISMREKGIIDFA